LKNLLNIYPVVLTEIFNFITGPGWLNELGSWIT